MDTNGFYQKPTYCSVGSVANEKQHTCFWKRQVHTKEDEGAGDQTAQSPKRANYWV